MSGKGKTPGNLKRIQSLCWKVASKHYIVRVPWKTTMEASIAAWVKWPAAGTSPHQSPRWRPSGLLGSVQFTQSELVPGCQAGLRVGQAHPALQPWLGALGPCLAWTPTVEVAALSSRHSSAAAPSCAQLHCSAGEPPRMEWGQPFIS